MDRDAGHGWHGHCSGDACTGRSGVEPASAGRYRGVSRRRVFGPAVRTGAAPPLHGEGWHCAGAGVPWRVRCPVCAADDLDDRAAVWADVDRRVRSGPQEPGSYPVWYRGGLCRVGSKHGSCGQVVGGPRFPRRVRRPVRFAGVAGSRPVVCGGRQRASARRVGRSRRQARRRRREGLEGSACRVAWCARRDCAGQPERGDSGRQPCVAKVGGHTAGTCGGWRYAPRTVGWRHGLGRFGVWGSWRSWHRVHWLPR